MTEDEKNELKFMAARNNLQARLMLMADFVRDNPPEKIGKQKHENLKQIAGLGIMLIMENDWQHRTINNLRKDLNAEMRMNTELIKRFLDGETKPLA